MTSNDVKQTVSLLNGGFARCLQSQVSELTVCFTIEALFIPVSNAAPGQIIGRHLNTYSIAHQNPNPVLTHLA